MAKNQFLKEAQKILKQLYYVEFKGDSALEISTDPESLPFAFLVWEKKYEDSLLLSLRVGYDDPMVVADITLVLSNITHIEIVDEFYIDAESSKILWGKEAQNKLFEQNHDEFLKLEPINNLKH